MDICETKMLKKLKMYINLIPSPSYLLLVSPLSNLFVQITRSTSPPSSLTTIQWPSHVKVAMWQFTSAHHIPINVNDIFTVTNNGLLILLPG